MKTKELLIALIALLVGLALGWIFAGQQAMPETIEEINDDATVSQHRTSDYLSAQLLNGNSADLEKSPDRTKNDHYYENKANGSFYEIENGGGECSDIGTWNGSTCTLTEDIHKTIKITGAGITLDCDNHLLSPIYNTDGILVPDGSDGVTIKNCDIVQTGRYAAGIRIFSNDNMIDSNTITDDWDGIDLIESSNNTITDNTFGGPWGWHIYAEMSNGNIIDSNTITEGNSGINLFSSDGSKILNNIINNTSYAGLNIWSNDIEMRNNTVFNSLMPIRNYGNHNTIIGNTVKDGEWGIDGGGDYNQILNNDISGQYYLGIGIASKYNTVANNHIYESGSGIGLYSYPVSQWGPEVDTRNNLVENNIIENGLPTGEWFNEMGIMMYTQGHLLGSNNVIRGNTIRNMAGEGIRLQSTGDNNVFSKNIIVGNGREGIWMSNPGDNQFYLNDIYGNGGTPVVSDTSAFIDFKTDKDKDDLGNYWGVDCPASLYFEAGVHSNASDVLDRYPFGYPVANLGYVPHKRNRPCL